VQFALLPVNPIKHLSVRERVLFLWLGCALAMAAPLMIPALLTHGLDRAVLAFSGVVLLGLAACIALLFRPTVGLLLCIAFFAPQIVSWSGQDGHWKVLVGLSLTLDFASRDRSSFTQFNVLAIAPILLALSALVRRQSIGRPLDERPPAA